VAIRFIGSRTHLVVAAPIQKRKGERSGRSKATGLVRAVSAYDALSAIGYFFLPDTNFGE
jgi:hypothetical protein